MLANARHDLTMGFDKVAGVDVMYPLGGLHTATVAHSQAKIDSTLLRGLACAARAIDPAHRSFVAFERYQYTGARPPFILAPSNFVRRHFEEYLGIPADQVQVLHCAIDPGRFAATDRPARRGSARRRWDVGPSNTVALFVAMNYRLKGLEPLLRAVARLPSREGFKLVIIGHPRTGPYQRLAGRLGVSESVIFAGFHADPRDAYFGADLLVHPTFYDPCSLVVLEALACGLPVITSAHNGASELLDVGSDGLVVKNPHDVEELALAISHYLDPVRRQQAARVALRNAQKWTFDLHHRRLLTLLREALLRSAQHNGHPMNTSVQFPQQPRQLNEPERPDTGGRSELLGRRGRPRKLGGLGWGKSAGVRRHGCCLVGMVSLGGGVSRRYPPSSCSCCRWVVSPSCPRHRGPATALHWKRSATRASP